MSSAFDTYRLHCFHERGRAELIRLIFVQANKHLENIRHDKEDGTDMPLEQLPVLEFNGEKYPQSIAIVRFVARKLRLTGKSELDQFKCDIIAETVQEINERYIRAWLSEEKEERRIFIEKHLPFSFKRLEILFEQYSKDGIHFVGDEVTWADLIVFTLLDDLSKIDDQDNFLKKYSKLKKNREDISRQPNIANYLKSRARNSK